MRDLLLQKNSGAFELAVWNDQPTSGSQTVAVTFASAPATVNLYDPTTGTAVTQSLAAASSVSLTLTDRPVIVEIP